MILERNVPLELGGFGTLAVPDDDQAIEKYFAEKGFATLLKRIEGGPVAESGRGVSKKKKEDSNSRQEAMF